jgi:hypothetical protein
MKERVLIKQLQVSFIAIFMVITLLLPQTSYAANVQQRMIYVNGTPMPIAIIMQNDYQMVPAIWFQNLSATINWSEPYRSAVVKTNLITIGFPEGKRFTDFDRNGLNQWERDELHTTNFIHEGRMYVPLGYTARKLGMDITYDVQSKSTSIQYEVRSNAKSEANEMTSEQSISGDDLHWLNQITEAEAGGESYKGKVAVAATILNRVKSPDWPDSIKETIFQVTTFNGISYYQFSPVLDKRIYEVTPTEDTKKAVQAALSGEDTSDGAVVFYNPDKTDNQWVRSKEVTVTIGNHIFAK